LKSDHGAEEGIMGISAACQQEVLVGFYLLNWFLAVLDGYVYMNLHGDITSYSESTLFPLKYISGVMFCFI